MTIKPPPLYRQPELLPDLIPDKPIAKGGEARTRYGAVVNEIVNGLLDLTDIPNSGSHDVVFDAYRHDVETFVEVKSLRRGSALPTYEWRREKDQKAGVPLVYVIGIHNCAGQDRLGDVWRCMAKTLDILLVMPATVIDEVAGRYELRHVNAKGSNGERAGHKRAGYCKGYRSIPATDLLFTTTHDPSRITRRVRGLHCSADVFFHPSMTPWSV